MPSSGRTNPVNPAVLSEKANRTSKSVLQDVREILGLAPEVIRSPLRKDEQLRMLEEAPARFAHLKLPVLSAEERRRESIYGE